MKKVININFQGRVIPIEETAYEMLQQYISSLRDYFASEEGRDEIINDIENRIAELFGETLKKGAACITDTDVDKVMTSMGRPEDFESEEEGRAGAGATGQSRAQGTADAGFAAGGADMTGETGTSKKRLYRDEQDKIIGGVASGLANYLNIDPAVIRIIFALLAIFGGSGFLIYIILWIVLPSRSLVTNIRKRLYRDTEDRVISGVCGGLAKYFDINPAIPRIIFAAPFIFGIITSLGRTFFHPGPVFVGGFGGGTFILVYIILWIVLPEANTAAEKLEMRGEKVDLNSIRDTVMGDLQGVKGRAQKMGEEFAASAQRIGSEVKENLGTKGRQMGTEVGQVVRSSRGGLGNALAILIKAFLYFVGGIIAIGLFIGLIVLMGAGVGVLPLKDFLLQGPAQNLFAWGSLLLFIGIPIVAILVWFIRRLMRVQSHNKYLGYAFTTLWFVGLFCVIALIGSLSRSFGSQVSVNEDIEIRQPQSNKLELRVGTESYAYYDGWFDFDGVISLTQDTLYLNTARINVVRSKDDQYHMHLVRISKGRDKNQAQHLAEKIEFQPRQDGDVIYLPETFRVHRSDKWRNQRVMLVVEVPVGKEIRIDDKVNDYEYFSLDLGRRRNWRIDWNGQWEEGEYWEEDRDMKMTEDGLRWKRPEPDTHRNRSDYYYDEEEQGDTTAVPKDSTPSKPPKPVKDSTYQYRQTTFQPEQQPVIRQAVQPEKQRSNILTSPLALVLYKI